jgi:hypothetical protein
MRSFATRLFAFVAMLAIAVAPVSEALAGGNSRVLAVNTAAGTALSNSTTQTVLASYQAPANAMQVGKVYKLRALVRATSTNSTDTLQVRLRVGPTTLTGTVVADGTAVDVANNDVIVVDVEFSVRSVGSSGVVIASGFASVEGAEGTATMRVAFEPLTLDSTVAQNFEITGLWSVASASNSCQAESFTFVELVS